MVNWNLARQRQQWYSSGGDRMRVKLRTSPLVCDDKLLV